MPASFRIYTRKFTLPEISATLVICTEVDPSHPSAYTRSGLEVRFRPHKDRYSTREDGAVSTYPKTIPFFSVSNMYGASEPDLRDDGHKWEPGGDRVKSLSLT